MTDPNSNPNVNPDTEIVQHVVDSIGELAKKENISCCIFAGIVGGHKTPAIFYCGELLAAAKLAGLLRKLLVGQVQEEITP